MSCVRKPSVSNQLSERANMSAATIAKTCGVKPANADRQNPDGHRNEGREIAPANCGVMGFELAAGEGQVTRCVTVPFQNTPETTATTTIPGRTWDFMS